MRRDEHLDEIRRGCGFPRCAILDRKFPFMTTRTYFPPPIPLSLPWLFRLAVHAAQHEGLELSRMSPPL